MRVVLCLMVALSTFVATARAEEKEPTAIIELGGTGEWGLPGASSFGPSAAVEFTPIKEWLEIEAGIAPMFSGGRTEWDTDLLFKNRSHCPTSLNLWLVLDRPGQSRERERKSAARLR
jgi:hypothetical protein